MIAAGSSHTLMARDADTPGVWTWGDNAHGQLGDGSTTRRTAPVTVTGLANVASVGAGVAHSLAVRFNGTADATAAGRVSGTP
ncbi:RCC1 domain-containing protein [Actinomadura violacea]|uniref:Regulator of chromosome condensation (RCC1) repeat protein n=1 Tax=Actinomadura violacea TaxID=2819934 RepID=A0ABS3S3L1_9ACTN|nr:RCC1 domain-containing protein [Actinomadura violacea]MBO2463323.1 hypothetical protein [Actinomadura violacea]